MSIFKRKQKEEIKGTIEVFKKENDKNILLDTIDILEGSEEEVKPIKIEPKKDLKDEVHTTLTDADLLDMEMVKELRDAYPKQEDFKKFVTDACAAYQKTLDDELHDSDDDNEDDDITIIKHLNDDEYNKMLADSLKDPKGYEKQKSIEKSYQERYENQKNL